MEQAKEQRTMASLQELYENSVPCTLQCLAEKAQWPTDQGHAIAHVLESTLPMAGSNGSVMCKIVTHAWILTTGKAEEEIHRKGPVDGAPEYHSSFRVELQGQLAILLLLGVVANAYRTLGRKLKCYCDNLGIIKCLRRAETGFQLNFHGGAELDHLIIIK